MHRWSLVVLMVLASLPRPARAQDAGPANLAGAWKLDPEASTFPPEPAHRREGGEHGGGGGMGHGGGMGRHGGMGGPGGMMGGAGRPSEADMQKLEAAMRRLREAPQRLTIVKDPTHIAFTEETGAHWAVTVDGKKQKRLTGDGEIDVKGSYDGDALVVEEDLGKMAITYRYRVLTEGDRENPRGDGVAQGRPAWWRPRGPGRPQWRWRRRPQ